MHKIEILPSPQYRGRQNDQYAFAYKITITNRLDFAVKMLNRHWIINQGNGDIEEVRGEGVVGEKPRLEPGQSFTYTSGALIPTPNGSMSGSYEFVTDSGEILRATIPEFVLAVPESLH